MDRKELITLIRNTSSLDYIEANTLAIALESHLGAQDTDPVHAQEAFGSGYDEGYSDGYDAGFEDGLSLR